ESPRTPVELLPIVERMQGFLGLHPEYEVSQLNLTAARAGELFRELGDAMTTVISEKTKCAQLLIARDEKAKALRKRLRGLINELDYFMEPNDPRWRLFGLNMPDSVQRPDQPENVTVTLINNTDAHVTWEAPARAERYHIFQRIVGIDSEPVNVGASYDPDFVLAALPPQAEIEIAIRALNEGGESGLSEMVTVKTGA
ncbi:MAG: hypothetical protein JWM68_2271, partial [Verrucomicrobiales bacterium]|nr:hypothetical protein [Verrucomicrobiales bacterium]